MEGEEPSHDTGKPKEPKSKGPFYEARDALERKLKSGVDKLPCANIITGRWRTTLAAIGLAVHPIVPAVGGSFFVVSGALDWVDGMKARADVPTEEGQRLDPFVDKVVVAAYLAYLAVLNANDPEFLVVAGANVAVDVLSQKQRGSLTDGFKEAVRATLHPETCTPVTESDTKNSTMANLWGKLKFGLQNLAIMIQLFWHDNENAREVSKWVLLASVFLGVVGTLKRLFMRKK